MLKCTFQCFTGIGADVETRLWESGCLSWRDFRDGVSGFLSPRQEGQIAEQIGMAESALASGMPDWFLGRLKGGAQLRVLHEFMEDALFLDIETTGLGPGASVTSVATWQNGVGKCFVRGFNLDDLLVELAVAPLVVTYNGKRFDLPMLRRQFGLALDMPHLDMMYPLRALGYRGGLKGCERRLGFRRRHSDGVDGAEAVYLWRAWRNRGDVGALRRLAVYNLEDTFSLAWLAVRALPLSMPRHPSPPSVEYPSWPDMDSVLERTLS